MEPCWNCLIPIPEDDCEHTLIPHLCDKCMEEWNAEHEDELAHIQDDCVLGYCGYRDIAYRQPEDG